MNAQTLILLIIAFIILALINKNKKRTAQKIAMFTILFLITVIIGYALYKTNWGEYNRTLNNRFDSKSSDSNGIVILVITILVVGFGIIPGIVYGVARGQKATVSMSKPAKILSFSANISAEKAMKIIINYAQQNRYKVDDFNESNFVIVLSDIPAFNPFTTLSLGFGFFYPIYLTKESSEKTNIKVGIQSKLIQWWPVVTRNHVTCFNGIKTALFANQ